MSSSIQLARSSSIQLAWSSSIQLAWSSSIQLAWLFYDGGLILDQHGASLGWVVFYIKNITEFSLLKMIFNKINCTALVCVPNCRMNTASGMCISHNYWTANYLSSQGPDDLM